MVPLQKLRAGSAFPAFSCFLSCSSSCFMSPLLHCLSLVTATYSSPLTPCFFSFTICQLAYSFLPPCLFLSSHTCLYPSSSCLLQLPLLHYFLLSSFYSCLIPLSNFLPLGYASSACISFCFFPHSFTGHFGDPKWQQEAAVQINLRKIRWR